MKIFQNIFAYPAYLKRIDQCCGHKKVSFQERREMMAQDGLNGVHLLEPVLTGKNGSFWTCGTDERLQRIWATENGLTAKASLDDILLAQIESCQAEVFYTQAPYRFDENFMKRLPRCVQCRVGWHSPPAPVGKLTSYDLVINNFPESLKLYGTQGVNTAYFTPSFDPVMADYCDNTDRPVDIVFVGGYSRHHLRRAAVLEAVAKLGDNYNIRYAFNPGRLTRLAETPIGWFPPLQKHARPKSIQAVSHPAVFGRDMYEMFSQAKMVLNGAVDLVDGDRGNMRCFEAMGCGSLLLTDSGNYPEGMMDNHTMKVYKNVEEAIRIIDDMLKKPAEMQKIAQNGLELMKNYYSKAKQWKKFQDLVTSGNS